MRECGPSMHRESWSVNARERNDKGESERVRKEVKVRDENLLPR